ncbi:MAG: hypothetical protein J6A59_05660 [Lachnospiraceae bacterium]|nr:hypothetical protein [Lachnospiraceae bacterium]
MISEFKEKEGTTVIEKTNYGGYEGDYGGRRGPRDVAARTLGVIGTVAGSVALASLWNRNGGGLGSILGGGGFNGGGSSPSNVNINCGGGSSSTFGVFEKECSDVLDLTNLIWSKASAAREIDVAEKFSLYNSQIMADFGLYKDNRDNLDRVNNRINSELFSLYKYTRDKDDETRKELCDLKAEIAVSKAVRPYQDKLIQCSIEGVYSTLKNYIDSELCLRPKGVAVLPSEPTVTGIASYCCNRTPAAAGAGA